METLQSTKTGVKYRRDLRQQHRISQWTLLPTIPTVLSKHSVNSSKIILSYQTDWYMQTVQNLDTFLLLMGLC